MGINCGFTYSLPLIALPISCRAVLRRSSRPEWRLRVKLRDTCTDCGSSHGLFNTLRLSLECDREPWNGSDRSNKSVPDCFWLKTWVSRLSSQWVIGHLTGALWSDWDLMGALWLVGRVTENWEEFCAFSLCEVSRLVFVVLLVSGLSSTIPGA